MFKLILLDSDRATGTPVYCPARKKIKLLTRCSYLPRTGAGSLLPLIPTDVAKIVIHESSAKSVSETSFNKIQSKIFEIEFKV